MANQTVVRLNPTLAPVLPSASSAMALVNGEPGALPLVLAHTTMRAGIIGFGLVLAGQRQHVLRTALTASLSVEAFVLMWAAWLRSRSLPQGP